jgi:hypothetical protein
VVNRGGDEVAAREFEKRVGLHSLIHSLIHPGGLIDQEVTTREFETAWAGGLGSLMTYAVKVLFDVLTHPDKLITSIPRRSGDADDQRREGAFDQSTHPGKVMKKLPRCALMTFTVPRPSY